MNDEKDYDCRNRNRHQATASGGAVYGLGFIGAAIYFLYQATSFWLGVFGILKAIVWPAYLVFYALRALSV